MQPTVPAHLRHIADVIRCRGDRITMQLVCPCGCDRFTVYRNTDSPELAELRAEYEAAVAPLNKGVMTMWSKPDKTGGQRWYLRRFGHLFPERFEPVPCPPALTVSRIAVRCAACGAETVVFDNRCHGYDGAVCGTEISAELEVPMKQMFAQHRPERRIRVVIECTVPEDECYDLCSGDPASSSLFSECFTSVSVESETAPGKYRSFFDEETA